MERLAEQIVEWHNRHPLARRIGVEDVHTIGVVALPFVRATAQDAGVVEPVLTDVVSAFDELAGSPPVSRWAVWSQRVARLPAALIGRLLQRSPRTQWRAFNEAFIPGLSPARIERFALAHGYAEAPATPETRPWRVIVIDERLAAAHGGWPFEIYLMSAGIDVGEARTRVLSGRGIPSQLIGPRLWDPRRVGIAAALLALALAAAAWRLWPEPAAAPAPPPAAVAAASAASATRAAAVQDRRAAQVAAAAEPAAPASALAESAVSELATDADPPASDIRPRLVERVDARTPGSRGARPTPADLAEKPAATTTRNTASAPAASPSPPDPQLTDMAAEPAKVAVALVGPPGSKADAEALLARMKASLAGVHSNPESLQADVIETREGWRATVWPFPSREQAQLINATLVARGLRTKAVNF